MSAGMQTVDSVSTLRGFVQSCRAEGLRLAFIPTMGNLHDGHLRLVEEARKVASRVVVSVFVNPSQFGPGEDFDAYPRTPDADAQRLEAAGADLLFLPPVGAMYPSGPALMTFVEVPGLSDVLCGHFRPGHFRGVATVVCKLLNMVQPDVALFGEKDFQQLLVIRRMVADLDMPVRILGIPTVREADGLAMSSRNGYLSDGERRAAVGLYRCLQEAAGSIRGGCRDHAAIEQAQWEALVAQGFEPDYFVVRRAADLGVPGLGDADLVVLAAARLGRTRLIDNLRV